MGAMFDDGTAVGDDLQTAFRALVEQKCYDHGHGGYSGTLAEKSSVTELRVPAGLAMTGREYVDAIRRLAEWDEGYYWNGDEGKAAHEALRAKLGPHYATALDHAQRVDGDKWGPAFAVALEPGKWWVGGYCSS